jgi:hypothetical protein
LGVEVSTSINFEASLKKSSSWQLHLGIGMMYDHHSLQIFVFSLLLKTVEVKKKWNGLHGWPIGMLILISQISRVSLMRSQMWIQMQFQSFVHKMIQPHHILSFTKFISIIAIIHEDVVIRLFVHGFKKSAREWFKHLGRGELSSFLGLVEALCKKWIPSDHREWMPCTEYIKEMYSVMNKENIVEEDPQSTLENDEAMEDLIVPVITQFVARKKAIRLKAKLA